MSIKQLNLPSWKTHTWTCCCDYCGSTVKKLGIDAGDASENARKEGFKTISIKVELPMKWACKNCPPIKNTMNGVKNAN